MGQESCESAITQHVTGRKASIDQIGWTTSSLTAQCLERPQVTPLPFFFSFKDIKLNFFGRKVIVKCLSKWKGLSFHWNIEILFPFYIFKGYFIWQFEHAEIEVIVSKFYSRKRERGKISVNGSDNLHSVCAIQEGLWDKKHVFQIWQPLASCQ